MLEASFSEPGTQRIVAQGLNNWDSFAYPLLLETAYGFGFDALTREWRRDTKGR